MKTVLVTGSAGLIGSACVRHFLDAGWWVVGVDAGYRPVFLGPHGDTSSTLDSLRQLDNYEHIVADLAQGVPVTGSVDAIIHAAAQPAHDVSRLMPAMNWHANVTATFNLLEWARINAPEAPFVFCSSSKVYGGNLNDLATKETETRYSYKFHPLGVNETVRVDRTLHTLYGASKLAADVLVQEYGHTFNMLTVCFRLGSVTGAAHAGAPLHGMLSHMARCARDGQVFTVHGTKGKQVRDLLHADDVARAFEAYIETWRGGSSVFNLGGGYERSVSLLEAIGSVSHRLGRLTTSYVDRPRFGEQLVVINDTAAFREAYDWEPKFDLDAILDDVCGIS